MALIVEDGTGKADAESYISVADADTYHTAYGNPSAWSGASTPTKETALRTGAQYLDAVYVLRWVGFRANDAQALDWPRAGAEDSDGYAIDSDVVPESVRRANAIAALKHINGDTLLPDLTQSGTVASESKRAGPVEKSVTYVGGKSPYKTYSLVDFLLTPVLLVSRKVSLA